VIGVIWPENRRARTGVRDAEHLPPSLSAHGPGAKTKRFSSELPHAGLPDVKHVSRVAMSHESNRTNV